MYLNADEARALADELGLGLAEFRRRYTFRDEYGWTQLRFEAESCVFLEPGTNRCTVYGARPTQCRTFPFWRDLVVDGRWSEDARSAVRGHRARRHVCRARKSRRAWSRWSSPTRREPVVWLSSTRDDSTAHTAPRRGFLEPRDRAPA